MIFMRFQTVLVNITNKPPPPCFSKTMILDWFFFFNKFKQIFIEYY